MTRLRIAIENCTHEQLDTADAVIRRARSLAAIEAAGRPGPRSPSEPVGPARVDVPRPDLNRFNQLLGDDDDGPVGAVFA
jgi:hypothetical protein